MLALVMSALDEIRRLREEFDSFELPQHEELSFRERLAMLENAAAELFRTAARFERGH